MCGGCGIQSRVGMYLLLDFWSSCVILASSYGHWDDQLHGSETPFHHFVTLWTLSFVLLRLLCHVVRLIPVAGVGYSARICT
ncbi:hypothetical protein BC629DRAFT_1553935 [Irpex lacteus]|nr:hypothetical protein BC629DRAFT_1553935 [Irpex lacteus]